MMSLLQKTLELVRFEQIVERVVERAHVRIHFFLQCAGQKAEPLAGFDGRAREDDAIYLLREQRGDGHGYGEIRLPCAAGADGKNHVVGFDGFHVAFLIRALGGDGFLAEGARVGKRKCAAGCCRFARGACGDAQQGFHFLAIGNAAVADSLIVFAEDLRGALDLRAARLRFRGRGRADVW